MKTVCIADEVYEKLKDQLGEHTDITSLEDWIGKDIFIRTLTYHFVGHVEKIVGMISSCPMRHG